MRILFLSAEYPPETGWGGMGSYVACIAPALSARGHDVHVLSCVAGQARSDRIDQGVSIHRRPYPRIPGFGRIPGYFRRETILAGIAAFLEIVRLKVNFDVVEFTDRGAEGWMVAATRRLPTVAQLHTPLYILAEYGVVPDQQNPLRSKPATWDDFLCNQADVRFGSWIERFAVRHASAVTSPSAMLADEVAAAKWIDRSRIKVVPTAIDANRWSGIRSAADTEPIVQFCGRFERRKSPETLIDAIAILRRELPKVTGSFAGAYHTNTARLPAMPWSPRKNFEGCTLLGHMPRSSLPESLEACRVFAQPSLFENFSVAALEAMAAGRAVVLTSKCGLADFVKQNHLGEIVSPNDAPALATALRPYLTDSSYAAEVGARARDVVCREMDPNKIASIREQVYRAAVRSFHGQARVANPEPIEESAAER
jgi:glycogen synthase